MVSKRPLLQKERKIRKSAQTYLDCIQKAIFTKKEENQLKTHLSDGIQEAVFTKKKEK